MDGRLYRVRRQSANGKYDWFSISIPAEIGRLIPSDARFAPILTEEGILLRFVGEEGDERGLPHWVSG
ncbi:MAG: hypothetical protein M3123_05165 [Actinomycetota bacterium]|nr:hypothetical protein [Actinomycetota bacterium]